MNFKETPVDLNSQWPLRKLLASTVGSLLADWIFLVDGELLLSASVDEVEHDSTEHDILYVQGTRTTRLHVATRRLGQQECSIVRAGLRYLNPAIWRSELASKLSHTELILLF